MDPSTAKFLQARAYAVLPCSSSLAAFYTSQTPNDLVRGQEWCRKCGTFLLDGNAQTRVSRTKKLKQPPGTSCRRNLRIACLNCGHEEFTPTIPSTTPAENIAPVGFEQPRSQPTSSTKTNPRIEDLKSRKQYKSHLQSLLAQNQRKKTQRQNDGGGASGGLAAFLDGLS